MRNAIVEALARGRTPTRRGPEAARPWHPASACSAAPVVSPQNTRPPTPLAPRVIFNRGASCIQRTLMHASARPHRKVLLTDGTARTAHTLTRCFWGRTLLESSSVSMAHACLRSGERARTQRAPTLLARRTHAPLAGSHILRVAALAFPESDELKGYPSSQSSRPQPLLGSLGCEPAPMEAWAAPRGVRQADDSADRVLQRLLIFGRWAM